MTSPAGRGEPVCHLDFDGCLHRCGVQWSNERGMFLDPPGRHQLFEHALLLEELLAPHSAVRLVLSTAWAQKLGLRLAVRDLPESLQRRVIGATYDFAEPGDYFSHMSRGEQVVLDVERRRPSAWLALDADPTVWPKWTEKHVVFTDPCEGISPPAVQAAIRVKLATFA